MRTSRSLGTRRALRISALPDALARRPWLLAVTLHEAIVDVLLRHGGGWMNRDEIATEIARRNLYRRADGAPPPSAGQVRQLEGGHTRRRDGRLSASPIHFAARGHQVHRRDGLPNDS